MMRPFDGVILNEDLPKYGIKAGTEGVIVDSTPLNHTSVMVEFFDADGATIDVVDVGVGQLTVTLADYFDGDSVALLNDIPQQRLQRGQVGMVKQRVKNAVYEVEFAAIGDDPTKHALLHAQQLLLLHWETAAV
jgi:hypothetical protein